ncbi:MAG: hypothetical protein ACMUIL_01775 [bacterium]
MADWSKNNRACKTTWFTLHVLNQNDKPFKDSGNVRMNELTFWNQSVSAEMRQIQARALSIQMHNNFTMIRRAKLEDGVEPEKAIGSMVDVLMNGSKTISDFAGVIDENYLFLGEKSDDI